MTTSTTSAAPPVRLKIDVVSDVVCPWCAIGWASLQTALERVPAVLADVHFQPFELNPQMAPEGEDIAQHLARKYRLSPDQLEQSRQNLVARGAALGVHFGPRERTYNTFDAHRLLQWAGGLGGDAQRRLKTALLQAYHGEGRDISDPALLARLAAEAGLDEARARAILAGDEFAAAVREREAFYQAQGVTGVPAVILNDRYLISGGQPPEVFEQALRQVAAEEAAGPGDRPR